MAIRPRFFGISTVFSVVLASGAFAPVAADSFVLEQSLVPSDPASLGEPTTDERSSALVSALAATPASPAAMDAPSIEQTDAGLDPIAEAFAESTRLSVRARYEAPEPPAYP